MPQGPLTERVDHYTLRLVNDPGSPVYVNLYGDGQTVFTGASTVGLAVADDRRLLRNLADAQVVTATLARNGADADTLTLAGASWSKLGFGIGTLFTLNGGATLLKVNDIADTLVDGAVTSSEITLTLDGALPGDGTTSLTLQRKTYALMFDSTNWYREVKVSIAADTNFVADPDQLNVRNEPVREHLLGHSHGDTKMLYAHVLNGGTCVISLGDDAWLWRPMQRMAEERALERPSPR